jgi:hypothetical protein
MPIEEHEDREGRGLTASSGMAESPLKLRKWIEARPPWGPCSWVSKNLLRISCLGCAGLFGGLCLGLWAVAFEVLDGLGRVWSSGLEGFALGALIGVLPVIFVMALDRMGHNSSGDDRH